MLLPQNQVDLHERCLRTIYNDKQSSFNELLEKDGSTSIHEVLVTEIYKISNGLSTPLMKDIFPANTKYLESWAKNMGSGTMIFKRDMWPRYIQKSH